MTGETGAGTSGAYLLACLDTLSARVGRAVERRRAGQAEPDDRFRGLYISPGRADELLSDRRPNTPLGDDELTAALARLEVGADGARFRTMAVAFGLAPLDLELLLVAMAPDLEPRFEQLYGYLNDDVSRRRASIGLALELCGAAATDVVARGRLGGNGPLVSGRLVVVDDTDRPFLSRALLVPDRVVGHLLGSDEPDPVLLPVLARSTTLAAGSELLGKALRNGTQLVYVREGPDSAAVSFVAGSLARAGLAAVVVDIQLMVGANMAVLAATAMCEARLQGGALVACGLDALRGPDWAQLRNWTSLAGPVVLIGSKSWDPRWAATAPLIIDAPPRSDHDRLSDWETELGYCLDESSRSSLAAYRMSPEQVALAASAARQKASAREVSLTGEDLLEGARAQNAAGLESLARRRSPRAVWDDLVLPDEAKAALHSISARARHRDRVYREWGLGQSSVRRGITALFAGESGTGKTMSAEVVAGSLGLDFYIIDLSSVVDKYIGETEKNLDRIFREAERVNGVLLFDEADAIFGRRSEVKDARDRYANIEVAYLLQRMELFHGITILTTNLRANIDEAFLRRIDVLVDFPFPDADCRRQIWRQHLGARASQEAELDIGFLAGSFELTGGSVRNVVLAAAFDAADEGCEVSMRHLVRAIGGEYRKLGRLCVEPEFGPYLSFLWQRGGSQVAGATGRPRGRA